MIAFPVVWLVTVLATIAAVTLVQNTVLPLLSRGLLAGFLVSIATLAALLGLRLSGWADWAFLLQPVIAVMIAPFAFLGFRSLTREGTLPVGNLLLWHGLPIFGIQLAFLLRLPLPIDFIIMVVNVVYLVRIAALLRLSDDDFPYTPPHSFRTLRTMIIGTVVLFALMITADLVIIVASMLGGNGPAMRFISGASGFMTMFFVVAALVGTPMIMRNTSREETSTSKQTSATDQDRALLEQIDKTLIDKQLYRDSAITLARLGRRLGMPSRDISNVINRCTGNNFSRYINEYRVKYAQQLLAASDLPVTEIMLEAGFISKSSFNTEFKRIVGQTPSQFRASQPST
ncbi:helix-turn-helix domain-containing protein [Cohaesibacter celericrescens]|uniref:helix-turn-helix domain-containing protein n=1 Tax=Cohaesibacter celericrescens TaxID=2067669 RepID=UPI0035639F77